MAKRDESELIHISEHELDREWNELPHTYHKYAKILADARVRLDEAKAEFELVEAELSRAVRATPEQYGLTKTTEALIEHTVKVQISYQRKLKDVNEAKYDVSIAQAALDTLSVKKTSLENLVILWCRDYNSVPRIPSEHSQAAREKMEESTSKGRYDRARNKLNGE